MKYYAHYDGRGKLIYKESTNLICEGTGVVELTAEEFNALDVAKEREVFDLKQQLAETDYIACKIAEGSATAEEYAEVIAKRKNWRSRINSLDGEMM